MHLGLWASGPRGGTAAGEQTLRAQYSSLCRWETLALCVQTEVMLSFTGHSISATFKMTLPEL